MPPNKSNEIINSFFTLRHTCSALRFLDIYFSSLPYQKNKQKFQTPYFLNVFITACETASSMYSAILNGIVGVHIDKRVAIGTRSANQNHQFQRICRGVQIEARPNEYSISFPGDLIRDTAHAQRQFPMWEEIHTTT